MALQIIGAGLGRTGTASIKLALEQLGIGRCYHMGEVFANLDHVPLWESAAAGKPDWPTLFSNYGASMDFPSCSFWRELMDFYPQAKVLLSTRDPESWFDSVNETIFSAANTDWLQQLPLRNFFETCVWKDFSTHIQDREFMVNYYQEHLKKVIATVPAERLLVFDVKQGWAPLCGFLNLETPDSPFPRVNSREETRKMLDHTKQTAKSDSLGKVMKERSKRLFTEKPE